jgi:hypothetical protein
MVLKTFTNEDCDLVTELIASIGSERTHMRDFANKVWPVFLSARKVYYGYYFKNRSERAKNKTLLASARAASELGGVKKRPLVSVLIATYNRGDVLTARTIPSVLKQTCQDFEVIVVGDHCTDDTEQRLAQFNDCRIHFYNLPKRGEYPTFPADRWQVAGTVPANKAIELCSGEWIAPLDDDDEFTEDHIEVLLDCALNNNYEMVYGIVKMVSGESECQLVGSYPPEPGSICHLSVLYHSQLKFFKYDIDAWKYGEPGDWNMWRRMREAGVSIGFVRKVVGIHY